MDQIKEKIYEYEMHDYELDLIYQFRLIFSMNYVDYYTMKTHFLEDTLKDRVRNFQLNKILHIIMDYFEDEILHYGEFGKHFKGQSLPFEKGLNINVLTEWFYERITMVILLYLTTGRNHTILLLTRDNWKDKLYYNKYVSNISIEAERIPQNCSTLYRIIEYY